MKKSLLQLVFTFAVCVSAFSQVKFNEIQPSNSRTQMDPDFFKYKDWVELYNTSASAVNIGGYYLTDDKDKPRKWQVPQGKTIAGKGYLIVYCDGEDVSGKAMHTNFKLSGTEKVYLYSSTMYLMDSVRIGAVENDYTWGRLTDGKGEWGPLSRPTPGAANVSTLVKGKAPKPSFSMPGGFYPTNQSITLSTSLAGATIRYTTDGSEPNENSTEYTGAITAAKSTNASLKFGYDKQNKTMVQKYQWQDGDGDLDPNYYTRLNFYDKTGGDVDRAFVIKAKVFHDDYVPSTTVCQTYFINMDKPSLPVVSLVTDKGNFFSADSGIYIQGTNGVRRGGSGDVRANWNHEDWERLVYVEYYDENGQRQFGVNAGAKAMGAVSRHTDLKSLNIIMRNKYEEGVINYPIFGDGGLQSYKSFVLRNAGNDWEQGSQARDAMIQSIVRGQVDLETQGYNPVIMFLNGEYWSLINMRERYDKHLYSNYYDYVKSDDMDLLKIDGDHSCFRASEGDSLRYEEMKTYLAANSMTVQENYDYVKSHYIDVDNMINYYIAELYSQNTDWPNNNMRIWRPRNENGKFRFSFYDADFGYGLWGGEAYENPFNNFDKGKKKWISVILFYQMMENPDFKNEFIQRFYYMINTVYDPTRSTNIINGIENKIKPDRKVSDKMWRRGESSQYSGKGAESLVSFAEKRCGYMRDYLNSKFGDKGTTQLTVNFTKSQGSVQLCGLNVEAGYAGLQYKSTPIRLTATPKDGYQFIGWKVGNSTVSTDQQYYLTITSATSVQAMFEPRGAVQGLKINEILASNSSIIQNENKKYEDWIEIYNSENKAIDLAGLYISDDESNPKKYRIPYGTPDSTTIAAGGYLLLWADNESQDGPLHLPFKLNRDGDTLVLSQVSASGAVTTLDRITFAAQNKDVSFGCYPDGNTNKIVFTAPTPRASNRVQSTTFISAGDLVINEVMAKNNNIITEETGSHADWFEIYNTTNSDIDLAGLFVTKDLDNLNMYMIPKGQPSVTTVPAKGYKILWADKQTAITPLHVDFRLSATGGSLALVQLQGATNKILDQVTYTAQTSDISFGRYPNGTGDFSFMTNPTPGSKNEASSDAVITGIYVNEVLALNSSAVIDDHEAYSDYIEIYNDNNEPVSLAGVFISDKADDPLRYRIPTTNPSLTTVPAKGWLVLWADGNPQLGENHLGFALSGEGESVVLTQINSQGSKTLDQVSFGRQDDNVSYGRFPEKADNWEQMTPTPARQNESLNSSVALKSLSASAGVITPAISTTVLEYECILPYGTESVPTISATTVNEGAQVAITQSTSFDKKATIQVVSKNGYNAETYTVSFVFAPSPDASLASLTLGGGTLSPSFNPEVLEYVANVTTTFVPYITAIANDQFASVVINYAETVDGTTTITVTAEDGTQRVYSMTYSASSANIVTEWSDDFTAGVANVSNFASNSEYPFSLLEKTTGGGPGVPASTEYMLAASLHVPDDNPDQYLGYLEYHLPTGYVLNGSKSLYVSFDCTGAEDKAEYNGYKTSNNYFPLLVAVVDAYGRVTSYNTYGSDVNPGKTMHVSFNFTGETQISTSSVVAIRIMMLSPTTKEKKARDKAMLIDNLVIGPENSTGTTASGALSTIATLNSLSASAGTLSPAFSNDTKNYTLTLPAGTTTVPTISAVKTDAASSLEISQSPDLNGTAYVRVISEDMQTMNEFAVQLNLTPSKVDGYIDYIIQPSLAGWSENSDLYALTYKSGEVSVAYTRNAALNDAIIYNVTDAASKIINLTSNPYASVRLKPTKTTSLTVTLYDIDGVETEPITVVCAAGSQQQTYFLDFTDKFGSADKTNISGMNLYFDKGSSATVTSTIAIDELRFGSDVVVPENKKPVWREIANQTIQSGETFTNISLGDYASDEETATANLLFSVKNNPTNLTVTITDGIASVAVKSNTWIGNEKVTFVVTDEMGASAEIAVTFTVTELRIPLTSVSFTRASVSMAQGETVDLSSWLTYTPADATVASVEWSIAADEAAINTKGEVTNLLDYGTETVEAVATVTDKNSNKKTATINVVLTGCATRITNVAVEHPEVELECGETHTLAYTLAPANACLKSYSYSSSNEQVATVSATGIIVAKEVPGTANIVVQVNDGFSTKTATCVVTVLQPCVRKNLTVEISEMAATIYKGESIDLVASITTENACNDGIEWSVVPSNVVTVANGRVTAKALGTATVRAYSVIDEYSYAECVVTVAEREVESVTFTASETSLLVGQKSTFAASVLPTDADNQKLTWTSSNPAVATVTSQGVVTAIAPGTATIKATAASGKFAQAVLTVSPVPVAGISVNVADEFILKEGETQTINVSFEPDTATNKNLVWSSSNPAVAIVEDGVVQALTEGSANITIATSNPAVSKTIKVTVQANVIPVTSVTVNPTTVSLNIDETRSVTATVLPTDATNKAVTWTSNNPSVATVSSSGVITAKGKGTATITAKAGSVSANVAVTVTYRTLSSVSFKSSSVDLAQGESLDLNTILVLNPANVEVDDVDWSVSGTGAAISPNGVLRNNLEYGSENLTVTVTVTDKNGNSKTKTLPVTITGCATRLTNFTATATVTELEVKGVTQISVATGDACVKSIEYTSSNPSAVSVNERGRVTALAEGTSVVTIAVNDGFTTQTKKITFTVAPEIVPVASVALNKTSLDLVVGGKETLTATVLPANATNTTITWTSTNPSVATVSDQGVVTAVAKGSCIIKAAAGGKSVQCAVSVDDIYPTAVTLASSSISVDIDKSAQLTVTRFTPNNATNTDLTYTSNNTTIATVDASGRVTGVSAGTTTITITSAKGVELATATITVKPMLAESVSLNSTELTLKVGEQQTLIATVLPEKTTNKSVSWLSSDPSVVTVDGNGKITAVSMGDATITAKTANNLTATCAVSVTRNTIAVSSVTVNPSTLTLYIGDISSVEAQIQPATATNKTIVWSSNKTSVATVSQKGSITAVSAGVATITATSSNNVVGTCVVTVKEYEVETVTLSSISLAVGESQTLSAVISPANATNKTVSWSVSDPSIATISASGKITGVAEGTTTVYATAANGVKGQATVKVSATAIPVRSIVAKNSTYVMNIDGTINLASLVNFEPANATNKSLTAVVISSEADYEDGSPVVAVSNEQVTALIAGSAKLRITSPSANVSTDIVIEVNPIMPSKIQLNKNAMELIVNGSEQLTATILPANASNKAVEWKSSDMSVAYVSSTGLVRAVGTGTARITAVSKVNSSLKATCVVTVVEQPITKIIPDVESLTMNVGFIEYISLTIEPESARESTVTWRSTNPSVASVDEDGQVIANSLGETDIIAMASNGVFCTVHCTVAVPNVAPQLLMPIPAQGLAVGSPVTIDLKDYFYDEDVLLYFVDDMGSNVDCSVTSKGEATFTVKDEYGLGGDQIVTVMVKDPAGLSASAQIMFAVTGVKIRDNDDPKPPFGDAVEDLAMQNFQVHPNPTEGPVTVSFATTDRGECLVEVFSAMGGKITEKKVSLLDENTINIDLSGLTKGVYFVVVTTEKAKKQGKVVLR